MSSPYPPFITAFLEHEGWNVLEVYRNGPRYLVVRVSRRGEEAILKAVVDDTPWCSPGTGDEYRPSDQLKAEVLTLKELEAHHEQIAGKVPRVLGYSLSPETWMLGSILAGEEQAAGPSSFVYRRDFYDDPALAKALIEYILSYQKLTPMVQEVVLATPHTNQTDLRSRLMAADIHRPTELLAPYAESVRRYLDEWMEFYEPHRNTFSHGEVFPPHILVDEGRVGLIDWENANLNTRLHDFVNVWIRGFDNPEWQDAFVRQLIERGVLETAEDWTLWRLEVMVQASRNLNYFYWSTLETAAQKTLAISSLRRKIEEILHKA